MTIKPGRPFWTGFTAFASNMVVLLGMDKITITELDVTVNWGGAIVSSLLVAAAVYGKAKIDSVNGKEPARRSRD
jgi:hypothetical protein